MRMIDTTFWHSGVGLITLPVGADSNDQTFFDNGTEMDKLCVTADRIGQMFCGS